MNSFENLFITILQYKLVDKLIGVVYRPPGTNLDEFNTEFDTVLDTLTTNRYINKNIYLAGDFNVDLLAYENHIPTNELMYFSGFSDRI